MKTILPITKNAAFIEAQNVRDKLTASLAAAKATAEATARQLADSAPQPGSIENALSIIDGTSAGTQSHAAALENADAVGKIKIFQEALSAQNLAIYQLVGSLSGELSSALRQEHAQIVRAIADALKTLGAALQAERDLRDRVDASGYRCALPSFQSPNLGLLGDRDSQLSTLYRAADSYATDVTDELDGRLDKSIVIRLLTDCHGVGIAGDIVEIAGKQARSLIRLGRAEPSNEKLRRVLPKPTAVAA